ncbi:MAG: T9SS C-terminal target domain-containing protein, partial [Lysobacterales bacterium]
AGNAGGAFTWFDVDSDGDLDYFVAGGYYMENGGGLIEARTQLFRNDATALNAAPLAAGNLVASPSGDGVTLSWSPASDDDTPASALTYDLQIVETGAPLVIGRALPQAGSVRGTSWALDGLADGTYRWSVRALDSAFNGGAALQGTFTIGGTTSVRPPVADHLSLSHPYPNPFSASSSFVLTTPAVHRGQVAVYDVTGRRVAVIHDGPLVRGDNTFSLDGAKLASGVYFIRATAGGQTITRRITLVR